MDLIRENGKNFRKRIKYYHEVITMDRTYEMEKRSCIGKQYLNDKSRDGKSLAGSKKLPVRRHIGGKRNEFQHPDWMRRLWLKMLSPMKGMQTVMMKSTNTGFHSRCGVWPEGHSAVGPDVAIQKRLVEPPIQTHKMLSQSHHGRYRVGNFNYAKRW